MGIFDNLSKVKIQQKSEFFSPGNYIVQIDSVEYFEGYKGSTLKIACTVTDSMGDNAKEIGAHCAQIQKMDGDKRDMGLQTLMGFLCAVYACDPEDKTDKQWRRIVKKVTEENSLEGRLMRLDCFEIILQKSGNPFTVHQWHHQVDDETFDEIE